MFDEVLIPLMILSRRPSGLGNRHISAGASADPWTSGSCSFSGGLGSAAGGVLGVVSLEIWEVPTIEMDG
jgi:hypothetical protein